MKPILLIDFGSTYTKVTAVDVDTEEIIGTSQSYTTIETDIINGLNNAVALLKEKIGDIDFVEQYACSSAAGGLRMVAIGLVPELTAKAARQASLGAGAKVIKTYSYELTEGDLREIDEINPDICLLTGGTDGGNKENIVYNARMLAKSTGSFPIIIAGNRNCADTCREILGDKQTHVCENVMPRLDIPNVEPVQNKIREIFLEQIVKAKGLSNAEALVKGILMPTPSAMLTAMKLLSKGTKNESGIGDLVGVDLGGATTDIYSMSFGLPTNGGTALKGLREEYAKRTVEGDIGMRYSIHGIVDAAGIERIAELSGLHEDRCSELIDYLSVHTDVVPGVDDDELEKIDFALASMAIETAVTRHAGRLEPFYSPMGISYIQTGKDLTEVKTVIVTGGALIHTKRTAAIASHAQFNQNDAMSLKPKSAEVLVDRKYILAAMGLLSTVYPDTALRIMKRELIKDGTRN
ncbi:MAG: glutamate mutase L [Clostridia bacterium]|nr:glutamate mutase L [Clostridia bacterium]MBQ2327298.1 glutamate mutase L [Clostridia bacterium]MBQ5813347.1 glutamate mutase L [Clostridia bacterium]